ncbi:hypothetical protein HDR62_03400 [bacterium]|nr:hypothetical protein [bacterium]
MVAEQPQEQTPTEGQQQGQDAAEAEGGMDVSAGQKAPKAGLKESIIPTVQKPQIDPNKTEGGVLLDTIITNAHAAYQRRKQQKQRKQEQDKFPEKGSKIGAEEFKQLMYQLGKEGVDLAALHKNGDMDRLLQGRITKEVYTRTPAGSWLERSGALFLGEDNKIHQTLIKQDRVMEKDLTAKQNEQLRTEGEVLKGDTLIKRNPKTRRVQRIPASQEAKQRHQQKTQQQLRNRRTVAPKKKMVKRGRGL